MGSQDSDQVDDLCPFHLQNEVLRKASLQDTALLNENALIVTPPKVTSPTKPLQPLLHLNRLFRPEDNITFTSRK